MSALACAWQVRPDLAGGVLALAVFFAVALAADGGRFHQCRRSSPGSAAPIAGLQGPEDFEVDAAHDAIIVSSTNRRAPRLIPIPATGFMP